VLVDISRWEGQAPHTAPTAIWIMFTDDVALGADTEEAPEPVVGVAAWALTPKARATAPRRCDVNIVATLLTTGLS
jgi:hypothetical protein